MAKTKECDRCGDRVIHWQYACELVYCQSCWDNVIEETNIELLNNEITTLRSDNDRLKSELHAVQIAPEIERLEKLREFMKLLPFDTYFCTTFVNDLYKPFIPLLDELVRLGVLKIVNDFPDHALRTYELIADTDAVIDAAIQKLKEGV